MRNGPEETSSCSLRSSLACLASPTSTSLTLRITLNATIRPDSFSAQAHQAAQTPAELAEERVIRRGFVSRRRRQHRKTRLLPEQYMLDL